MTIHLTTDNTITGSLGLTQRVEEAVIASLDRFSAEIMRLDVRLSDENSGEKHSADDKRCLLEAHLPGLSPLVITHNAATVDQALDGGIDRLKRLLAQTLDRRKDHR